MLFNIIVANKIFNNDCSHKILQVAGRNYVTLETFDEDLWIYGPKFNFTFKTSAGCLLDRENSWKSDIFSR